VVFISKLARRENELKKQKMFEEMEAVNRQAAELHGRRQAQEKVLNDMFCQLIQQELQREQERVQDNKVSASGRRNGLCSTGERITSH
jgi:hypothetical protein